MRRIGDELPLRLERRLQAVQHRVELVGEVLELVGWPGEVDALLEPLVGDAARRVGDLVHGPQHPPGDEPAEPDRRDRHHPQRDARPPEDLAERVLLDAGHDGVEQRGGLDGEEHAPPPARGLALDEERELALQVARPKVQALLERVAEILPTRGEVAGDEREVEGEQDRAREQEQRTVPEREPQPDRWLPGRAEEPPHQGMR